MDLKSSIQTRPFAGAPIQNSRKLKNPTLDGPARDAPSIARYKKEKGMNLTDFDRRARGFRYTVENNFL